MINTLQVLKALLVNYSKQTYLLIRLALEFEKKQKRNKPKQLKKRTPKLLKSKKKNLSSAFLMRVKSTIRTI